MKKALVIGGNGFLGSYVTKKLFSRGYDVYVADIMEIKRDFKINFTECNILIANDLVNLFKYQYDYVFHLAGMSKIEDTLKDPVSAIELNTMATTRILDLCVKNNVKQFVYASSAYASSTIGSFYGVSKLASEKIIEEFNFKFNLNYTILRYGSIYSKMDSENNYMFNLIKNALNHLEINHPGDGMEIREYIHADDAAERTVDVIENPKFNNNCLILTGIEQIKRIDLFNMIKEISGKNIKINLNIDNQHNLHYKSTPYNFRPSLSRKFISNPQIDLGQGILQIIETITDKK